LGPVLGGLEQGFDVVGVAGKLRFEGLVSLVLGDEILEDLGHGVGHG
jgi:hypothetical protein